jgi:hypothetical protein
MIPNEIMNSIASIYPSCSLSVSNKTFNFIISDIYLKAIQLIRSEMPHIPSDLGTLSAIKEFSVLMGHVRKEAEWLNIDQTTDPSNEKIVQDYLNYKSILDDIKLTVESIKKKDFEKFVQAVADEASIYISNLDFNTAWDMLKDHPQVQQLTELDLISQDLRFLPSQIGQLSGLEYLYLNKNHLRSLPVELNSLVNLKTINLDDNDFVELPNNLMLTSLVNFYCNSNKLIRVPNLELLPNLHSLFLNNNYITEVSESLNEQTQTLIFLVNNPLIQIPSELSKKIFIKSNFLINSDRFEVI